MEDLNFELKMTRIVSFIVIMLFLASLIVTGTHRDNYRKERNALATQICKQRCPIGFYNWELNNDKLTCFCSGGVR